MTPEDYSHTITSSITPELVVCAYEEGLFPMADEHGEIGFFRYEPRGIIPLDERFTVRRSLRQVLKRNEYRVTFDTAPEEVLCGCARAGRVNLVEQWLSEELIVLYLQLFAMGRVHTVEVWKEVERGGVNSEKQEDVDSSVSDILIGGLYGLTFGAVFCGESMFSLEDYASQIALVYLVDRLRMKGFQILDAQMPSDHLKQFGLYEMSQEEYLERFREAAAVNIKF